MKVSILNLMACMAITGLIIALVSSRLALKKTIVTVQSEENALSWNLPFKEISESPDWNQVSNPPFDLADVMGKAKEIVTSLESHSDNYEWWTEAITLTAMEGIYEGWVYVVEFHGSKIRPNPPLNFSGSTHSKEFFVLILLDGTVFIPRENSDQKLIEHMRSSYGEIKEIPLPAKRRGFTEHERYPAPN